MPFALMDAYQAYFDSALAKALARYEELVGQAFTAPVDVTCADHQDFWAYAFMDHNELRLEIASGTLERIREVWANALTISCRLPSSQRIELIGDEDRAVETSVAWLLQHELNHQAIGHFTMIPGAGLSEAQCPTGLGIVELDTSQPSLLGELTEQEKAEIHRCLELQTDHDATEIVLGAYAKENWPLFRYYAVCILAVLFIIEAEERRLSKPIRQHPFASTRLFMLLGHLTELPMIPGIKRAQAEGLDHLPAKYLPTLDEIVGYRQAVMSPVLAVSQVFAEACGIPEAWNELGSAEAMFADIDTILINQNRDVSAFRTQGARQWAELKPTNDNLLMRTG
ncbi:hypothetical protein QTA57_17940 [Fontisubflavum oceani]|uniref:hypothetical protein n=1 Tax=Fontisubflavum oceani TaxID=2978973 RepID=UPI0025B5DF63|nr:hypothetical protein [Fontisubflavum oceani]WJY21581.1 hypothetical protein QTA57_17940 [Fontisubflavum oceani]